MTGRSLRILVVEDEMMIAFFIEDCLDALGHTIVGPASRVANALQLVATESFDLALLDINVAGEEIYPVAHELKSRGIPFVFLSGYGSRGLSGEWVGSPMLPKPFVAGDLETRLQTVITAAT
ncbi:MAG: response regulator [Alphaproteobacteria bacterium]|mgnify:CR=1 FL=1|nr:response regulator [Alphaproteobacteria bacterium]